MTPLPKHLQELRQLWMDETHTLDKGKCIVFEAHRERPDEWDDEISVHVIEAKAIDLMLADLESMAKALEFFAEPRSYPMDAEVSYFAREALKNYREKYKGEIK